MAIKVITKSIVHEIMFTENEFLYKFHVHIVFAYRVRKLNVHIHLQSL